MMKPKGIIERVTKSIIIIFVVLILFSQVEFEFTVSKKRFSIIETLTDTVGYVMNGARAIRAVI